MGWIFTGNLGSQVSYPVGAPQYSEGATTKLSVVMWAGWNTGTLQREIPIKDCIGYEQRAIDARIKRFQNNKPLQKPTQAGSRSR